MRFGILSGALWGLDTVILAIAVVMVPFVTSSETSLVSALLHDTVSALILFVYMVARGRLHDTVRALKTRSGQAVVGAAILGGPVGMTGYLTAINHIGPGLTAIISTFYPAVGTLLAYIFLKERMYTHQLMALMVALGAVIAVGWSTQSAVEGSPIIGVIGALACVIGWGSEAAILAWGMRDDAVDNETALHIRQTTSATVYLLIVAPLAGVLPFTISAVPHLGTAVIALAALAGTASYLFYYQAIHVIGASRGMALNISYSAWAIIFALLLQGTVPTLLQSICCVIILVSTVLAATPRWRDLISRSENVQQM
ncbi:DMT family transporter [Actinomyces vulturis]|uniref:DMT family transporter n=1 Tax=Actinomyces vulturis TaxID=1857645 RepID=UPI00082D2C72|nr:DMT family transporter [Actinomyces vulturis]